MHHSTDSVRRIFVQCNVLLIAWIPLSPTDIGLPFVLRHPQFAMMTNKAQDQMLQCVGVLLDEPVFCRNYDKRIQCMSHHSEVVIQILCTDC